ncbi:MAG: hypothetical protein ABL874_00995 [Sphingopyxis sp.]
MSSSEELADHPKWFFATLAGVITFAAIIIYGHTYVTDPFAIVHPDQPHRMLCADASFSSDFDLELKPLILHYRSPEAVFIGSSKVSIGFDAQSVGNEMQLKVANLGVVGGDLRIIEALVKQSADTPSVQQIWIGVDYGTFTINENIRRPILKPEDRFGDNADRFIYGVVDTAPVMLAWHSLVQEEHCGLAVDPATGSYLEARQRPAGEVELENLATTLLAGSNPQTRFNRIARLVNLVRLVKTSGKQLILFIPPNNPDVSRMLERKGARQNYDEWRRQIHSLGQRFSVPVVDNRNDAGTEYPRSAFHDLTHFRPNVGDDIVRAGLAQLAE